MKYFLLLTFCLLITASLFAQDNVPYDEKARQIQKDVSKLSSKAVIHNV